MKNAATKPKKKPVPSNPQGPTRSPRKKDVVPDVGKKSGTATTKRPKGVATPNVRRERFCELIVAGKAPADAWLEAGYNTSRDVARRNAHTALTKDDVQQRIAKLREEISKKTTLDLQEKLEFLTKIIRTPIDEVDAKNPICSEFVEESLPGGGRRTKVKMCDKLRALELHSKLVGDFAPEKVEVNAGKETLEAIRARAAACGSVLSRAAESLDKSVPASAEP